MFCYERAIKLFLWSCVVFPYTEGEDMAIAIGDEILSLLGGSADNPEPAYDEAMKLLTCTHKELIYEKEVADMKVRFNI